jgi:hypothetical protein
MDIPTPDSRPSDPFVSDLELLAISSLGIRLSVQYYRTIIRSNEFRTWQPLFIMRFGLFFLDLEIQWVLPYRVYWARLPSPVKHFPPFPTIHVSTYVSEAAIVLRRYCTRVVDKSTPYPSRVRSTEQVESIQRFSKPANRSGWSNCFSLSLDGPFTLS